MCFDTLRYECEPSRLGCSVGYGVALGWSRASWSHFRHGVPVLMVVCNHHHHTVRGGFLPAACVGDGDVDFVHLGASHGAEGGITPSELEAGLNCGMHAGNFGGSFTVKVLVRGIGSGSNSASYEGFKLHGRVEASVA